MDEKDKEKLRQHRVQLTEDLSLGDIWDGLIQVDLFTPNELKKIERQEDPITRLLDILEQKGPKALDRFLMALQSVNTRPHLVALFKENEEKGNEEKIKNKDSGIQVKKEFADEPDSNASSLIQKLENYSEIIANLHNKLAERDAENEQLNLTIRQLERHLSEMKEEIHLLNLQNAGADAYRATRANDYVLVASMSNKINLLIAENGCLTNIINEISNTVGYLRNENRNIKNQLDQIELTRKRTCESNEESKSFQFKKRKTNDQSGKDARFGKSL